MVNLVAGTAPGGRSLTPQDKGSLGKKKSFPIMWWERRLQAATGKRSLGKKKKLPGLGVTVTDKATIW
ncbi:MAG: hypothetical protein WC262_06970 [Bacteroidales bacterium]|jgi:hypothetical protein